MDAILLGVARFVGHALFETVWEFVCVRVMGGLLWLVWPAGRTVGAGDLPQNEERTNDEDGVDPGSRPSQRITVPVPLD